MFNSILIKHPSDYGQMIENLFFYEKTFVHIGREQIKTLFDLADVDVLNELLRLSCLSVFYNNSHTGVANQDGIHYVDSFGLASFDIERELYEETYRHKKDSLKSKKFSKRLSKLIEVYELPTDFNKVMNEQLKDNDFRQKVLLETINYYHPHFKIIPGDIKYELEFVSEKLSD